MPQKLKHLRDRFFTGPRFLGSRPTKTGRYQSPTLAAGWWWYALIVRHFTLAGRIVIICSGLIVLYSMFTLDMPVHLLAFAILTAFALNIAVGFFFKPRLDVQRWLPERVAAGTEERFEYTVSNKSAKPAWSVMLDSLPFPKSIEFVEGRACITSIPPRASAHAHTYVKAHRRGRYLIPALRADSAFPFHLWRFGFTGVSPESFIVCPDFTPLRTIQMGTGVRYQPGGVALSSNVGESMEFFGCREFRDGDDPRRLHWRSWARTTYPVVKEFREEYLCRTALIIDTYRPRSLWRDFVQPHGEDDVLEAGISISAAVTEFFSRTDYIIDLFAAGPDVYRFQGGRSLAYLENILDILACLEPHHGEPFADFSAELVEEIGQISSAVFVLLTWNETRRKLIEAVTVAGVDLKILLVTESAAQIPPDLPAAVRVVPAADIRNGAVTVL